MFLFILALALWIDFYSMLNIVFIQNYTIPSQFLKECVRDLQVHYK